MTGSGLSVVERAAVRQIVRGTIAGRVEHKITTVRVGDTDMSASGAVGGLTQYIVQGDNLNERSGDVVRLEDLKMYWTFRNTVALGSLVSARVIIFADTLNVGSVPAVTDVLEGAYHNSGYYQTNLSKNRFKIYSDFIVDLAGHTVGAVQSRVLSIPVNKAIYYSGTGFAAASNGKHAMYYLVISDVTGAAGQHEYTFGFTMKFTDS